MTGKVSTIPFNFGGLPHDQSLWENSRLVFLPVPYDLTSTYLPGSRRGPMAILEASTHMELFDEELEGETSRVGFHTLDPLEALASGPQEMIREIETASRARGSGEINSPCSWGESTPSRWGRRKR